MFICTKKYKKKFIPKNCIPISKTRNYCLNDTLLDFLNIKKSIKKNIKINIKKKRKNKEKKIRSFNDFILNNGILFENKIFESLKLKFPNDIIKICESYESRNIKYINKTFEELKKGTKIIYQGVLYDKENNIFGVPDLIVRSDILNDLFGDIIIPRIKQKERALLLGNNNYHYRIIDIKNSKLQLNTDNKTIRNKANIVPFKNQIYLYNDCLSKIQGYNPDEAYILSNGWFTENIVNKNKVIKYSIDPFSKPGIIEINNFDKKYDFISKESINWLKSLNKNYKKWTIDPPSNDYLYPNMNNIDSIHMKQKIELSKKLGEITLIWNCSIEHRKNAFNNNIYSFLDKNCNSKALGIKGKNAAIIDNIIKFQRDSFDIINIDKFKLNNLKIFDKQSFFVDFETININSIQNIFMIGLGYINNNKWIYKNYTVNQLNDNEEKIIMELFLNDLKNLTKNNSYNLYHWSAAEKNIFNKFNKKYNNIYQNLNWIDALNIFKDNNIYIKNCFNFSLKNIAKQMYINNFISTVWDDNEINNGLNAMYFAYNEYNDYKNKNKNIFDSKIINSIIKYNEVDCKVIYEILLFLKNYLKN